MNQNWHNIYTIGCLHCNKCKQNKMKETAQNNNSRGINQCIIKKLNYIKGNLKS